VETAQGKVYPLGIVLLIEGLDLLENPAELYTWFNRGVRMVGVTWNGRNQYASGCFADRRGFTSKGFTLLDEMARLGVILDTSHLSRRAVDEALEHYRGPICSGHTNAAAVCDIERNLTDAQAQATASRGGVIGLNLLASLVKTGWRRGDRLPTISDAVAHTLHLASLVGSSYVGLGVDLDGGLTPENTPARINRIDDIPLLANELDRHGWHPQQVADFLGRNWWRFFERSLPR
jgi:membrane dipeptidase